MITERISVSHRVMHRPPLFPRRSLPLSPSSSLSGARPLPPISSVTLLFFVLPFSSVFFMFCFPLAFLRQSYDSLFKCLLLELAIVLVLCDMGCDSRRWDDKRSNEVDSTSNPHCSPSFHLFLPRTAPLLPLSPSSFRSTTF